MWGDMASALLMWSEDKGQLAGARRVLRSTPGQQVALDQGEHVHAQLVGQWIVAADAEGAVTGTGVVFCFHRPRVSTMG